MYPLRSRERLQKIVAAALSAVVVAGAFAPGAAVLAAENMVAEAPQALAAIPSPAPAVVEPPTVVSSAPVAGAGRRAFHAPKSVGHAQARIAADFQRLIDAPSASVLSDLPRASPAPVAVSRLSPSRPRRNLAAAAAADRRIRASAAARSERLRLLGASIDLNGGTRWSLVYQAPAKNQIVTYGPGGASRRRAGKDETSAPLRPEDLAAVDIDREWALVRAQNLGFHPTRAEVRSDGAGGVVVFFRDAAGRARTSTPGALSRATASQPMGGGGGGNARAEAERVLRELEAKRYEDSKLAEREDLAHPRAADSADLRRLDALRRKYGALLPEAARGGSGFWDRMAVHEASSKAFLEHLAGLVDGVAPKDREPTSPLAPELEKTILTMLDTIEHQDAELRADIAIRDATRELLRAAAAARDHALKLRRACDDMMRFHSDAAKLRTVVELSLVLMEINAAEAAIATLQNILQAKQAAINASQQANAQNAANAAANAAQVAQWQQQARAQIAADTALQQGFVGQGVQAALAASRTASFQTQISALISGINALDGGPNHDALAQYQKYLNMLSEIAKFRASGNPADCPDCHATTGGFSLSSFQSQLDTVNGDLDQVRAGLSQLQKEDVEFAPVLVIEVPPIPAFPHLNNPGQSDKLKILQQRLTYWQGQLSTYQGNLNQVNQILDPNYNYVDEFGLVHNSAQSSQNMSTLHDGNPAAGSKLDAQKDLAMLDQIAAELDAAPINAQIPMLSSLDLPHLQQAIQTYGDALAKVQFPAASTPQVFQAKMDLFLAAQLTPMAARAIINWSVDQATIDGFQAVRGPGGVLPIAQQGLRNVISTVQAIIDDVQTDITLVNAHNNGTPYGRPYTHDEDAGLYRRKTALLQTIQATLQQAQAMLNGLVGYQRTSVDSVTGTGANNLYYTLFTGEQSLLTQTESLYNTTIPWALASFGAPQGNVSSAIASINAWKQSLQQYIDGYTDAQGPHEGITQYIKDLEARQCAANCDQKAYPPETLYGIVQPYSLPMKIQQFSAEMLQRASQIKAQAATINKVLADLQAASGGKYTFTPLPTDGIDVPSMTALVNGGRLQNLGNQLIQIGHAALAAGGTTTVTISTAATGALVGTVPGPQPNNNQRIALLALSAGEYLVPSDNAPASDTNAPFAYAVARYLLASGIVQGAKAAQPQVAQALAFLKNASYVLSQAIAQTDQDKAWIGASSHDAGSIAALYQRKITLFNTLVGFIQQAVSFLGTKIKWDQDPLGANGTIAQAQQYYNGLNYIFTGGQSVNAAETQEINAYLAVLQSTKDGLDQSKQKVTSWYSQLNPRQQSALQRLSDDPMPILDKDIAVLQANVPYFDLKEKLKRSEDLVAAGVARREESERALMKFLEDHPELQDSLPPDLVRRIESAGGGRGTFGVGGADGRTPALVIRKPQYAEFLDVLVGMLGQGAVQAATIKSDLLKNPQGLAALIPGTTMMNFGNDSDGFYVVYQSQFSSPDGLGLGSWVTLGNVAQLWGSNVSFHGYSVTVPPSNDGRQAPYGVRGLGVTVETVQNRDWLNYFTVDFHRFALDIPVDNSFKQNIDTGRLFVFDDFALLFMNGKGYFAAAGYGDMAVHQPGQNPYWYGGNAKLSMQFTEFMSLNATMQKLLVKDPRYFLENINLGSTLGNLDPALNVNVPVSVPSGSNNKSFQRWTAGARFDINRLLHHDGSGDAFTVDMFYARTADTDGYNQGSFGVTILKGFSIKDEKGHAWMLVDNALTAELGTQANHYGDRLTFRFPDQGLAFNAEGQMIGGKSTYFAELVRKTGDNTSMAVGWGSRYIGENNRLSITLNTSITLAQILGKASQDAADSAEGGAALKAFNADMDEFLKDGAKEKTSASTVAELSRVFEADVARKLIQQDMGQLTSDIRQLEKAGAVLDNTTVQGMVGFTSKAVSNDLAERVATGGFAVGTYTSMTLSRVQKDLIKAKSASLYREGLRLQDRLLSIARAWQAAVVELAEAQWECKLANFEALNAPSEAARREAEVRLVSAESRLRQAILAYAALTGRDPKAGSPFKDLTAAELGELMGRIQALIAAPDRYARILSRLDPSELEQALGPIPKDWLPWIDRFTIGIGVQLQDALAGQALTLGATVRLPIYDPASKGADKAYALDEKATLHEIAAAYQDRRLRAAGEREKARAWKAGADALEPGLPAAAARLSDAIRAYRNGLIGPAEMRRAFDDWRWYARTSLDARGNSALAAAQATLDEPFLPKKDLPDAPMRVDSFVDVLHAAVGKDENLAEVAARSKAAAEMSEADGRRLRRAWLDLTLGTGMTAQGMGFLPSIGFTGFPITPMFGFELQSEELRELQTTRHGNQKAYYDALRTRLEAGLAVQLYQTIVAFRSARRRVALFDEKILPALRAASARGDASAVRDLDQARFGREQAALALGRARATLNLLLGRAPDAELDVAVDEKEAFAALSSLLAGRDIGAAQRTVRDARVATARGAEAALLDARVNAARANEEIVDKNLRATVLQLEPVSIVMRSVGLLVGIFGGGSGANADALEAARIATRDEERARDAYESRRAAEAARLRAQLSEVNDRLRALSGKTDAASELVGEELEAKALSLRAGLLGLGEDPAAAPAAAASGTLPATWGEARRRLVSAARALSAGVPSGAPRAPETAVDVPGSGAYARYYYAKQTLSFAPIDKSYREGWIELRLDDPNTPPETWEKLARLRRDTAQRVETTRQAGAAAQAEALSAGFEADVRLRRWARRRLAEDPGRRQVWERLSGDADRRLESARGRLAALLGLPPGTTLEALASLVPEDADPKAGPAETAERLIADIRARNLDSVRHILFEEGLPASLGTGELVLDDINADTIFQRMGYRGFTPAAAAGIFRGTTVTGGFVEAPDPRQIERVLENMVSDEIRKRLQSDGRLRELAVRLHGLLARVEDGARELEARRRLIAAAEGELKARTELEGLDAAEAAAAEQRLLSAWSDFFRTMTDVKSAFIALTAELEALGKGSTGWLRPFRPPLRRAVRSPRGDVRSELLDFWTERLADPSFEAAQDALLAQTGAAVTPEARARVREAAEAYRLARKNDEAIRSYDYGPAERAELLMRNDLEGRRLAARAEVARVLAGLGALDPRVNPAAAQLIAFFRAEAEKSAVDGAADRGRERAVAESLRRTFWAATKPSPEAEAAFRRLAALDRRRDDARQALLTSYLTDSGAAVERFLARDRALDEFLKAQSAYDREVVASLESPAFAGDAGMARVLNAMHDVRASLERSYLRAKYGRGLSAIDALISVEESRLRAARWDNASPETIDRIAETLRDLRVKRERWLKGTESPEPLYAVARRRADGTREVVDWLTAPQARKRPLKEGETLLGGVDAARAQTEEARRRIAENDVQADLAARMKDSDFVVVGDAARPSRGLSYAEAFGPGGLSAQGRLLFFSSDAGGRALSPIAALSRPPEDVVMMSDDGPEPVSRERFPTLAGLTASDEAGHFRRLVVSPRGAVQLADHAAGYESAQLRRGWIEILLNGAGFARDASGRVVQLYCTDHDFRKEWEKFDDAEKDLAEARRALERAKSEERDLEKEAEGASITTKEADDELRAAKAKVYNAERAVKAAEETFARSKAWTLYRVSDLDLSLDASGGVVRASAPAARGSLPLDMAIPGGGAAARHLRSPAAAVVLDEDGRVVRLYADESQVDAAAAGWKLVAYSVDGEIDARVRDGLAPVKVRVSHYEETVSPPDGATRDLPVLLSADYWMSRFEKTARKRYHAENWKIAPANWANIALQIPRGVSESLVAAIDGREVESSHYLGRAAAYGAEGGEEEHQSFLRSLLGWVDVLNLAPDHVARYFDPSQFPDRVKVDGPLAPGHILADLHPRDPSNGNDVFWGARAWARDERHAVEDLKAARARTLARFNGGVERTILETRRGRGHRESDGTWSAKYLESSVKVSNEDPSSTDGETRTSASADGLYTERVETRTRLYPGVSGYERQVHAMDGYGARVERQNAESAVRRPELEREQVTADSLLKGRIEERERTARRETELWNRWHRLIRPGARARHPERARPEAGVSPVLPRNRGTISVPAPAAPAAPKKPLGSRAFWLWLSATLGAASLAAAWKLLRADQKRGA